ncbi:MAG TPA: porin family protein [Candidatus Krumholzibacteria bacterium]|nr:porin family protein [Candidatus Krumholzibacteria bacterium]
MKILAMASVCAMILVWSADAVAKDSYAGVRGGVNIADITGDDAEGLDSRNRFIGGAFYGINFEDFGVRVDGLYVQKGAEGDFESSDGDVHETIIRLDYIEFPVLFMVGFPTGDEFAVNLFAGPTFGFNLKAEAEIPEHGETEELDAATFELGGAFGGGFEYILSSMSFVADLRYALGGTSISDEFDGKNVGVGVTVGVKFPLGAR